MRVKDIVTESRILQEQLGSFITYLKYAIKLRGSEKGITHGIEWALSWMAKAVKSSPKAADELAKAWIKTAEEASVSASEAISSGSKMAKANGISDEVIAQAASKAEALAAKSFRLTATEKVAAAEMWYGSRFYALNNFLTLVGIAEPILEAIYYINDAYKKADAGDPEYQGGKLHFIVNAEINQAVARVIGIVGARGLTAWALGPKGIQALGPLGWGPIGYAFNLATPATQAAAQAWLISPPGQEAFARWLVGKSMLPGGTVFYDYVVDYLGGMIRTAHNSILQKMGSDKAQASPKKPEPKEPFQSALDNIDVTHGWKKD